MGEPVATLVLRVTPRSSTPGVGPWRDGVLHVRVRRPPLDGQATAAALAAVADALGVSRSAVSLAAGPRSRLKRVTVGGLTDVELARRLGGLSPGPD